MVKPLLERHNSLSQSSKINSRWLPKARATDLAANSQITALGQMVHYSQLDLVMPSTQIRLKRVYEKASADDGVRILVERLWPRGLTKADAAIDHWVKDVAPTSELRT